MRTGHITRRINMRLLQTVPKFSFSPSYLSGLLPVVEVEVSI